MPKGLNRLRLGMGSGGRSRQIITATLTPSGTLYDGENAADDLANIATFTDPANYASSAGTIVDAEYQINRVPATTDTVLSAGDILSIVVSDDAGTTPRRFTFTVVLPVENPEVVATITPAMSPLYDGDSVDDVTNWTEFLSLDNYTFAADVDFVLTGADVPADETVALSAGDEVGFTITVTPSFAGDPVVYVAAPITVLAAAPRQFGGADWSVANKGTGGAVTVTITAVPDDRGSAITAIEYQVDGGTWTSSGLTAPGTFDITGLTDGISVDIALRAVNAEGNGTASATKAVIPTTLAAVASIVINSVSAQQSDGDFQVSYSITQDDLTVEAVLFAAAESDPAAADFNGGGAPTYIDLGPVAMTVGGANIELTLPTGLNGSYKLAFLPTDGDDGDVAVSDAFTADTVSAILSGVSFADNTTNGVIWAFTPNEGGTYRVSIWPDGTDPSDALIASGTGALASTTGTGTASVEESATFGALGSGTYQPTIYYIDAFGNETFETYADAVVGGAIVTVFDIYHNHPAGTALTYTFAGVDWSAVGEGDMLVIAVAARDNATVYSHNSVTVGVASATKAFESDTTSGIRSVSFWTCPRPAASSGDIVLTFSEPIALAKSIHVFGVPAGLSVSDFAYDFTDGDTVRDANVDTVADTVVIALALCDTVSPVLSGLTDTATSNGTDFISYGWAIATATETRAINSTTTGATTGHVLGSVAIAT